MTRRLVLATGNRHKLRELSAMLADAGIDVEVCGPHAFGDPPEIVEDGDTFASNAAKKADGIAAWIGARGAPGDTLVLADDSGISVHALDDAPGVTSARWAGEPSDDAANNRKLVDELARRGLDRSAAHYSCVLALRRVDGAPLEANGDAVATFVGRWDVEVRTQARGTGGFGYDPHAWLPDDRTVAELDAASKASASHRGVALRSMLAWWSTARPTTRG